MCWCFSLRAQYGSEFYYLYHLLSIFNSLKEFNQFKKILYELPLFSLFYVSFLRNEIWFFAFHGNSVSCQTIGRKYEDDIDFLFSEWCLEFSYDTT